MYPYEIAATLKERGKEQSLKLRYGSLYTVVESLERDGLIAAKQTSRAGRRPERTVFEITEIGTDNLETAMSDLIAQPVKEYRQFEAALSLMPVLPPDRVPPLLKRRLFTLMMERNALAASLAEAQRQGLPALFVVENAYRHAVLEAEHRFVAQLIASIESGTWSGTNEWRLLHEARRAG